MASQTGDLQTRFASIFKLLFIFGRFQIRILAKSLPTGGRYVSLTSGLFGALRLRITSDDSFTNSNFKDSGAILTSLHLLR